MSTADAAVKRPSMIRGRSLSHLDHLEGTPANDAGAGLLFACEYASRLSNNLLENTCTIPDHSDDLPTIALSELQTGQTLGKGGYGTVSCVRRFQLANNNQEHQPISTTTSTTTSATTSATTMSKSSDGDDADQPPRNAASARLFLAEHCRRRNGGDARYAIKQLSPEVVTKHKLLVQGLMDMALETRVLSAIEHPNIVKIRAIAQGETNFHQNYFIIMDRLYDNLQQRLEKWERKQKRWTSAFLGKVIIDRTGRKRAKLYQERLGVALDLSAALEYLHRKRIIHRDLKPQNLGFDVHNNIQVFDFGLAKEIPAGSKDNETFRFTGYCGSPRYMAPEVANRQSYNEKCDVYSFAILFWEILALQRPYQGANLKKLQKSVWSGKQIRPAMDVDANNTVWSKSETIQSVLKLAWSSNLHLRPSMATIHSTLQEEYLIMYKDAACDSGKNDNAAKGLAEQHHRRSTGTNKTLLPPIAE